MKEKLIEIIQHYGTLNQLKYLHTEYFELDEAILEYEKCRNSKLGRLIANRELPIIKKGKEIIDEFKRI